MQRLYYLILYLLIPIILIRLAWRSIKAPAYRKRGLERFGRFNPPPAESSVWVHAVSVGEVNAAIPLVKAIRDTYPGVTVTITTVTPTGSDRVKQIFGDEVFHVYAPYDLPTAVNRFLDAVQPRVAIIMETEIWLTIFTSCKHRGIPLILANARLSERSTRGYRPIQPLVNKALSCAFKIAAQTKTDADRLIALGANKDSMQVTGSIKFDINLPASLQEQGELLRQAWGANRPVWIAASTHEGEDEPVLDAFDIIREEYPQCLLLLVPRHPERFQRVANLCKRRNFKTEMRSKSTICDRDCEVFVIDSIGELPQFFAACDVAFVAGSLVPIGGHNVLEPAALGKPVIVGPYTFNCAEITELLMDKGAAIRVHNAQELGKNVCDLLSNADARDAIGAAGQQLVKANRGAVDRMLEMVAEANELNPINPH